MSKNLHYEEYWTNTSVEDWSIESFDVHWIQQNPRLHHRSAQAHASLGNELSILARRSDQRIADKAQSLQKQLKNNPSEIHKIIWERSEEIASSQVHLSLSEILAKVNIKKTLVDEISESERKKKRSLSTNETRDTNCLGKKSKSDNIHNGETSKDNSEHEESETLVKNLLDELQQCSEKTDNLIHSFQKYCSDSVNEFTRNEIMDLTPSSEFVLRYTDEDDYIQVLKRPLSLSMSCFRKSNYTHQQWDNKLESLLEPEEDPFLKKLKRLLFETLPALQNHDMLEDEFMNTYIHPVLKKAMCRFSDIRYIPGNKAIQASAYRKSITKQEGNADRSDGIAYTNTEKSYEICVVEGSRPYVVDDTKEMSDYVQNARAGKDIINYTVVSEVKLKRAPPLQFKAYMVQSIGLSLRFYFMDYLGTYRLFEIETCEIPTEIEGVNLFTSFFKAVVTWALMVKGTDQEFRSRKEMLDDEKS
ncbi:3233_t:CDS:10 [Funneliformis mosseae]|uniref:3233_t:CDS:1 n=1 Tax=Funneliformis mosseae TaxID=27381 RepID=A0A9N9ELU0_FUNMO|nr:3233_t:CDS:10 [Funneliformis mosseae]